MEVEEKLLTLKIPSDQTEKLTLGYKEEKSVCEVCGFANEKNALMCKMCSNYIKTKEGK